MKPAARWTSAILLPFAAVLLHAAWVWARSVLHHIHDPFAGADGYSSYYIASAVVGLAGVLFAAAVSLLTGPRLALVGAALLMALCLLAAGVLGEHGGHYAMHGAKFALGMSAVGLYGAAVEAFEGERAHARDAVCVLIYVCANAAAFGGVLTTHVDTASGARVMLILGGASALGGALVAGVLALVVHRNRDEAAPRRTPRPAHLGVVVGLAFVLGLVWSLSSQGFTLGVRLYEEAPTLARYLDPTSCVGLGLVAALVLTLLRAFDRRVPTLVFVGLGFVLAAFALSLMLVGVPAEGELATSEAGSFLSLALGVIAFAGAQILVFPLLLSRLGGDLPRRFAPLAVGLLLLVQRAGDLARWLSSEPGESPGHTTAYVAVVLCAIVGVALCVAAFPLRRVFESALDAPAEF